MFDGSSIAGWKAIHESDMRLMPDPETATIDPFFAETTLSLVCDVLEPTTGEPYNRDPRGIAKKAEGYGQVDGRRRHRLFRTGSRILHLRRREVCRPALQHRLQAQLGRVPDQLRHRLRRRQSRPPHRLQEGLLPGAAAGHRAGHALGDARRHGAHGRQGREAPPRSRLGPARARHEVRADDAHGRPDADLQILHPAGRQHLRQDRDLHAEADLWRQRLGHALPPVDLEGRQADLCRQQIRRPVGDLPCSTSPASSSTRRRSTPSPTRRPIPTSGWSRASRRRCCSPIRRATARPPAVFRSPPSPRPSASRSATPIRCAIPISASPRC